ncbi:MAG: SPOR domain-containing protein [Desulfamplus sp.]
MLFLKGLLKYSGLFLLSGWMFFIGVLVGRGTSPVEFDTGWFQERLAVIFDDSETEEPLIEKPELDFYAALQNSGNREEYDINLNSASTSKKVQAGKSITLSEELAANLDFNEADDSATKNKKAMTSKLVKKQIATNQNPDSSNVISSNTVAKTDKIKTSILSSQTKSVAAQERSKTTTQSMKYSAESKSKEPLRNSSDKKIEQQTLKLKDYTAAQGYSYTIQIASFNTEADAVRHIAKLSSQGYSAYKSSGMVGDKTWYRIRIGSFTSITEAKESLKQLENSGIKGLIIQKE